MANSEIDIMTHEAVSLQVVTFECGYCREVYEVEIHAGQRKMVECRECQNASLQVLLGTE